MVSSEHSAFGNRGSGAALYIHIIEIVQNMSDNQIAAVAAWYAEQPHVRRRK